MNDTDRPPPPPLSPARQVSSCNTDLNRTEETAIRELRPSRLRGEGPPSYPVVSAKIRRKLGRKQGSSGWKDLEAGVCHLPPLSCLPADGGRWGWGGQCPCRPQATLTCQVSPRQAPEAHVLAPPRAAGESRLTCPQGLGLRFRTGTRVPHQLRGLLWSLAQQNLPEPQVTPAKQGCRWHCS